MMKWVPITVVILLAVPASGVLYAIHSSSPAGDSAIGGSTVEHRALSIAAPDVQQRDERVPDFSAYQDVRLKKQVFFTFMLPLIREANRQIREERSMLTDIITKIDDGVAPNGEERQRLGQLFKRYRMKVPVQFSTADLEALLERVDVVPASLVLAQSANESGWGTSRFAREANNYFGIWCFSPGCGITPRDRDAGMNHEVASYDSVLEGVQAYLLNINTHDAYRELRRIRAEQRHLGNEAMGLELADGLEAYSIRGEDYVREIRHMIESNNLHEFTLADRA